MKVWPCKSSWGVLSPGTRASSDQLRGLWRDLSHLPYSVSSRRFASFSSTGFVLQCELSDSSGMARPTDWGQLTSEYRSLDSRNPERCSTGSRGQRRGGPPGEGHVEKQEEAGRLSRGCTTTSAGWARWEEGAQHGCPEQRPWALGAGVALVVDPVVIWAGGQSWNLSPVGAKEEVLSSPHQEASRLGTWGLPSCSSIITLTSDSPDPAL